jgi:hypothetical protein
MKIAVNNFIFLLACKAGVRLMVYDDLVTRKLIRKNNFENATEKKRK